jgi:4'-phosphopantetheinyl transferase
MRLNTIKHTIYLFGGQFSEFSPSECWNGITLQEKEYATKFHHVEDQESFVIARSHLRKVLSDLSGLPPLAIQMIKNASGKSTMKQQPQIHFSVAHTKGAFVIAASTDFPVGVDIESVQRKIDFHQVKNVLLTSHEQQLIQASGLENSCSQLLLKTWTQKEALVKCLGITLESGMHAFEVLSDPFENTVRSVNHHYPNADWFLQTGNWIPSYFISVAMNVPENVKPNIEAHIISPSLFRCA